MIKYSNKIELFQNISQFDFDKVTYDFHNDFECVKVKFQNGELILVFKNIVHKFLVSLIFQKTTLTFYEFEFAETFEALTIDSLYRGKFENEGTLLEFDGDRGYFYLEFYESQKIEFWSESVRLERQ